MNNSNTSTRRMPMKRRIPIICSQIQGFEQITCDKRGTSRAAFSPPAACASELPTRVFGMRTCFTRRTARPFGRRSCNQQRAWNRKIAIREEIIASLDWRRRRIRDTANEGSIRELLPVPSLRSCCQVHLGSDTYSSMMGHRASLQSMLWSRDM